MAKLISPKQLADKATYLFINSADPKTARQSKSYFKKDEKVALYGIKAPEIRGIEKELFEQVKNDWSVDRAIEFCDLLISETFVETKAVGILLLARFHKSFESTLITKVEAWLKNNLCSNWATTDTISAYIITPYIIKFPQTIPAIKNWSKSQNIWLKRASLVSFVKLVRTGNHLETAYEICEYLFPDKEDLIQKAVGWLLRETGKTDPGRLESFLLKHGPKIPRTAVRYAIEKFHEEKRKFILNKTKEN